MDRSHKSLKLLSQLEMLENEIAMTEIQLDEINTCLLYTSPSPRD